MALAEMRTTLRMRFETWLAFLRRRTEGVVGDAPLREMVTQSIGVQLARSESVSTVTESDPSERYEINRLGDHLTALIASLEQQLTTISLR
ncbi:MAG: hypothetical protein ACREQ4_16395 [Candidatus Binataceae bacterium]